MGAGGLSPPHFNQKHFHHEQATISLRIEASDDRKREGRVRPNADERGRHEILANVMRTPSTNDP